MDRERTRSTRLPALLALLVGCAVLAGCGVTPPYQTASSTPTPPPPTTAAPTQSVPPPDLSASTEFTATGEVPRILDASLVADVLQNVELRSDATQHVFANWPLFGLPRIDAAIDAYYSGEIDAFTAGHTTSPDDPAPPELNLGWHLVASSPQAVGIVADGYEFSGASSQERWRSIWFDPSSDTPLTATGLLDAAATNQALAQAATTMTGIPGFDLGQAEGDPLGAATLVAFSGVGALLVGYDGCQVAACSAGRITIAIPAQATETLLTTAGRAARDATLAPVSPVATPTTSPAPTPSTSSVAPQPDGKVNCRKAKCIALSFDDGPGPYTSKLLTHLKKANVPATFFMLGQQVETYPKVTRAVAAGGHEIGVHTWDHRMLTRLTDAQAYREIHSSIKIVKQVTGRTPKLLRPPYGETNQAVAAQAKKAKVAQILWDVDTLDWKTRDTKKTVAAALKQTRRGSILLLHDIHSTSVAAVPGIIEGLRKKGYTFVTVGQLLGKTKPGLVYSHGSR